MSPPERTGDRPDQGAIRALTTAIERRPSVDLDDYRQRLAERLPGYQIEESLGTGGMGAVYRAVDQKFGRSVAIKALLPPDDPKQQTEWRRRFEREAITMARLQHPNILTVYDYGQDDELAWIVLEYVDGASLRDLLSEGSLSQDEVIDIAMQLGSALHFAHERGVIHRDVKPENVLLTERGDVKVADFGIAKVQDPKFDTLTRTDQTLGSRAYVAPELLRAGAIVDNRADVYAFGAVVYEMLTGTLSVGAFAPPSATAGVDADLDEPVLRALDPDPNTRTDTLADTIRALRRLRDARAAGRPSRRVSAMRLAAEELAVRQAWLVVITCAVGVASLGLLWVEALGQQYRGWDSGQGPLTLACFLLPVGLRTVLGSHHARRVQASVDIAAGVGAVTMALYPWWRMDHVEAMAPGAWLAVACGLVLALQGLASLFVPTPSVLQQSEEKAAQRRFGGSPRRD